MIYKVGVLYSNIFICGLLALGLLMTSINLNSYKVK